MKEPIEIVSYGPPAVAALTWDEVVGLRRAAAGGVNIDAADIPGSWMVRGGAYVGTLAHRSARVLVRPNIAPANLFHMLEAGGEAVELGDEVFEYDRTGDLAPAFATFFARVLERALAQGVHRAYEDREEALIGLRGRIDVHRQVRRGALPSPMWCRFDEFTGDVALNRVLRRATEVLLRLPGVVPATRNVLRLIQLQLSDAGPLRPADLATEIMFTRLNERFRSAHRLASMVLGRSSLLHTSGGAEAGTFLIYMPKVFEQFVEARLARVLRGRVEVVGQHARAFASNRRRPQIQPDLELRRGGQPVYVADAKYKLTNDGLGRISDYYQLLAYTTVLRLDEGLLVYCHADEEPPPTEVIVEGAGTRLFARAISLNVEPRLVDAQLVELAEWLTTRLADSTSPVPNTLQDS